MRRILAVTALLAASLPLQSAPPKPEIERPAATPQAVGALHSLRTIPEACMRFQGRFTGNAAHPYDLEAVRTSERCQPRARIVDAAEAKPDAAGGWILNDVIRVPSAACAGQAAELVVWRHPGSVAPPKLDAQGRSRVHLQGQAPRQAGQLPRYAIGLRTSGAACR